MGTFRGVRRVILIRTGLTNEKQWFDFR